RSEPSAAWGDRRMPRFGPVDNPGMHGGLHLLDDLLAAGSVPPGIPGDRRHRSPSVETDPRRRSMFRNPARLFRVLAIAEAITWTLLIAALIARAVGLPAVLVTIGGGIHGFVFLSYGATAVLLAFHQRWHAGV